ncbi:hypothetical protein J7I98_36930 [Streptomyces sp. ISL-98]|uniref:hypothetical protein n=1 Tax=Streptomyces sp. ISL-98 TaxID=2819192 RepID=UPI001BE5DB30|nr:hypothetical protein [Streptomyces sp. ISL-98]MBT2511309.1 hypothetical protein [Streptomyces sp. ISL-98]
MHLIKCSPAGWESWDVDRQALIRDRMPIIVDDDLRFKDAPGVLRPAMAGNHWLRELPLNGAPATPPAPRCGPGNTSSARVV